MANKTVSAREVFDGSPFTPYQVWVCFLCFCVTLLDGFDLTVIGVTLPKIREFLNATPSALGLAVGAGQLGPLVGAIVLGMLADRVGRKRMLYISALIFGVFTWLTVIRYKCGTTGAVAPARRNRAGWSCSQCSFFRLRICAQPRARNSDHHDVCGNGCRLHHRRAIRSVSDAGLRLAIALRGGWHNADRHSHRNCAVAS